MSDAERIQRIRQFVASPPEPKRPPLILPDELGVRAEDIFHHLDPAAVPGALDVLESLMEQSPTTLAAVGDVDRTLIWFMMEMTPAERLAYNERTASSLIEMQEAIERTVAENAA